MSVLWWISGVDELARFVLSARLVIRFLETRADQQAWRNIGGGGQIREVSLYMYVYTYSTYQHQSIIQSTRDRCVRLSPSVLTVHWLNHDKSLREQGVDETEVLGLRCVYTDLYIHMYTEHVTVHTYTQLLCVCAYVLYVLMYIFMYTYIHRYQLCTYIHMYVHMYVYNAIFDLLTLTMCVSEFMDHIR